MENNEFKRVRWTRTSRRISRDIPNHYANPNRHLCEWVQLRGECCVLRVTPSTRASDVTRVEYVFAHSFVPSST